MLHRRLLQFLNRRQGRGHCVAPGNFNRFVRTASHQSIQLRARRIPLFFQLDQMLAQAGQCHLRAQYVGLRNLAGGVLRQRYSQRLLQQRFLAIVQLHLVGIAHQLRAELRVPRPTTCWRSVSRSMAATLASSSASLARASPAFAG